MKKILYIAIFLFYSCSTLFSQREISTSDINWEPFLSQHDLTWDIIANDYYSGAILGNGLLGLNIYADEEKGTYRFDIGRSDVTENREGDAVLYDKARLPIGHFRMIPRQKVVSEKMRLKLWDAMMEGELQTEKGKINLESYVDANKEVIVIKSKVEGQNNDFLFTWIPEEAISPRRKFAYTHGGTPQEYIDNPNPSVQFMTEGQYNYSIQSLFSGWVYVTAWYTAKEHDMQTTYVTVSYRTDRNEALSEARNVLANYMAEDSDKIESEHREWWHRYYPSSYVSFPDARLESFYWIQQYKLACLTRQDKLIIDLMGPWTNKTPWPAVWWNLNIQLTYSPLFTANRTELSEPLWKAFDEHLSSLIENVPVEEWRKDAAAVGRSSSYDLKAPLRKDLADENQYEVGNLTWTLFYYWEYCIYKGDRDELLNKFYPLLKRSIAYYSHILYKEGDGKWHLPVTASPEYRQAADCNYDLALLRWGLNALLDINKQYRLKEPLESHWKDVSANLVDYPVDDVQGFMIGRDVKLESSHRHYSHLLMIYPLMLINSEQPENRDLIMKSLNHWIGLKGALQGYTFTGSSSMYSMMGEGGKAVTQLNALLDRYIQPNTLYKETGPVIETPLSAATSLQELYLQSWNGIIRVFPAVPADWKDASFIDFRTEGGFLISGLRENAETVFVQIECTVDNKCTVSPGIDIKDLIVGYSDNGRKVNYKIIDTESSRMEIPMKKGEIIIIKNKKYSGSLSFEKFHPESERNYFGSIVKR